MIVLIIMGEYGNHLLQLQFQNVFSQSGEK